MPSRAEIKPFVTEYLNGWVELTSKNPLELIYGTRYKGELIILVGSYNPAFFKNLPPLLSPSRCTKVFIPFEAEAVSLYPHQ